MSTKARHLFFGREHELVRLHDLFKKKTSSLVVCRGRRRIGKSTLIQTFGKNHSRFLEFQGLPPQPGLTRQDQLENFSSQLSMQTGIPRLTLDSWPDAFRLLASQIRETEKTVIFLDEISWMALQEKAFAGYLKIAWDTQFKKNPRLVMVLCGSVSSWLDKNILTNTGFVGRVSLDLLLSQLPLPQCDKFWKKSTAGISSLEKLKVLAITGGVPRYLEEIDQSVSADVAIRNLCFVSGGLLTEEFESIFSEIFHKRNAVYKKIVESLLDSKRTLSEIASGLDRERSGDLSEYCDDLEKSGYIFKETSFKLYGKQTTKLHTYRIQDNYIRFYLKYMEPLHDKIKKNIYKDVSLNQIIKWDTILGLQFESLILNNLLMVIALLRIDPATIKNIAPYFQNKTQRQESCQIDLLIHCTHSLYLCEIKCSVRLGVELIPGIKEKIRRLKIPAGISCRTALIYEGSLSSELVNSGFFDFLVPFEDFLHNPVP